MTRKAIPLPLPPHYNSAKARDSKYAGIPLVLLQEEATRWRALHQLTSVSSDVRRVRVLLIDPQHDFSFPEGSLYVGGVSGAGAMDDQDRIVQFIYRNTHIISRITCTLDSHRLYQIFHPVAHLKRDGTHPAPFTIISAEEYRKGDYVPNPVMAAQVGVDVAWLAKQFVHYCEELEKTGRYQLTIWPYHCIIGSNGHKLSGVVDEARMFHSFARGAINFPETKGDHPLTEHYSIFRPEVMTCFDGSPLPHAEKNTRLLQKIFQSDVIIIAGQAKSHCVAWSVADLLWEITVRDKCLARRVYLLEDCTSPVVIPGVVDYTAHADEAFNRFREAGMHVVKSTDPMHEWPDIQL